MQPTKLHIIRQEAGALLGPIRAELMAMEARTEGYVARLKLSLEDEEAIQAANAALATARAVVERLWRERWGR